MSVRTSSTPRVLTRVLWLVGLLHGLNHLYNVALLPVYLQLQRDLNLPSIAAATSLTTLMMLAYFLPSYPLGVLADRLDRRWLLTWGLVLNALGYLGLGWARNYPTALGCVVLAGLGGSFYHPAATALVVGLFPQRTGRALGLIGMGASAGFFLGPLYVGWRAASVGWRAPLAELGLVGLAAAALFSLRDFAACSMASLGSLFLQQAHGMDVRTTGLALSSIFLVGVVSNPLFGHLSDRARLRWIAFVLVSAAVVIAGFPRVPRAWLIPALLVYGFFMLANYPMVEAALLTSVPDAVRGRVFGLFIMISGLLGNLGHWWAGVQVRSLGLAAGRPESYQGTYLGLAGLVLLSLGALPCLHALRRKEGLEP